MNDLVKIQDLTKKYGDQLILNQFSLTIKKGEFLVIVGESGVGKTTLLKIISEFDKIYEGKVFYHEAIKRKRVYIPYVFQDFEQLLPWLTIKKNILLNHKTSPQFLEIVEDLELKNHLNMYPHQLSGGLIQRTAIARALLCKSEIIIMDEPFNSLDIHLRTKLQNLVRKLHLKYNKTIVMVTHNVEEAVLLGNRIVVLQKNKYDVIDVKNELESVNKVRSLL